LIVNQFQQISSFTAVVARVGSLEDAIEKAQASAMSALEVCSHHRRKPHCPVCAAHPPTPEAIDVCHEEGCFAYDRLTLRSPGEPAPLVQELSVSIPSGTRVLIASTRETAKTALFLATAGIWCTGEGRIVRPRPGQIFFLPERPYLPPAKLREVLLRDGEERMIADERISAALDLLDLQSVIARIGGLEVEKEWNEVLSLNEQQRFAVARLLLGSPRFAMLDRPGTALGAGMLGQVLKTLSANSITYLTLEDGDNNPEGYDALLDLSSDGTWQWKPLVSERPAPAPGNA
jgi:putative ATP-binding cassette transporter